MFKLEKMRIMLNFNKKISAKFETFDVTMKEHIFFMNIGKDIMYHFLCLFIFWKNIFA